MASRGVGGRHGGARGWYLCLLLVALVSLSHLVRTGVTLRTQLGRQFTPKANQRTTIADRKGTYKAPEALWWQETKQTSNTLPAEGMGVSMLELL